MDEAITCALFACNYRPLKQEAYRVCVLADSNKLPCNEDAGAPAVNLLETKMLLNSVISDATKGA